MEPEDFPSAESRAKKELRKEAREKLRRMTPAMHALKSAKICERVAAHPRWRNAKSVTLFAPQSAEPDVLPLATSALAEGKIVSFPKVHWHELHLYAVHSVAELGPGAWNLLEPPANASALVTPGTVDLILIPGVLFSPNGHRLGRGGGFYDRLAPDLSAWKLGICFAEQINASLPVESHDAAVNEIVTDSEG
jgi:5-formyltetrahydrofolate cyclo-ligase